MSLEPQYVYHLVGFDESNMRANQVLRDIEDNYKIWDEDELVEAKLNYIDNHRINSLVGCNRIGSFTSLQKAVDYIRDFPGAVCDQRYCTLLIEKCQMDVIDGWCFGDNDCETWFGINETIGDDGYIEDVSYDFINRPECFQRTFGFA